jgi:hypothetical protein
LLDKLVLFVNEQFRIAHHVHEQDVPDFQLNV